MKKFILLMVIVCAASVSSYAQYYSPAKVSFGIDGGIPLGATSNVYSTTADFLAQLELPLGLSPVNFLFTTGYTGYFTEGGYDGYYDGGGYYGGSYYASGVVASFIPVELGLKYYFNRHIFIEGNAGASFNVNTYAEDYTGRRTAFIYAPVAGYSMPIGFSKSTVDVSLRYESRVEPGGGYNQLALKAAFSFGLK